MTEFTSIKLTKINRNSKDAQNILISLANATGSNNTAALIQVALRALGTVNGVDVSSWTVTANATWTAAPATADVDLAKQEMFSGPYGNYDRAYLLPSDFLRIAKDRDTDRSVDPTGAVSTVFTETGMIATRSTGLYPYVMETLEDGTKVVLTDYDATETYPLELVYIKQETTVTRWTSHFISALSYRLAAELSFIVAESQAKFEYMMQMYGIALKAAIALDQTADYVKYETGSEEIILAGRQ